MRSIGLAVLVVAALMTFWACDSADDASRERAGRLVVCLGTDPQTLDPRYNTDAASFRVTQLLFNGLVKKDAHQNLIPDLAEKWEQPDDRTWVFHLKKGVLFHNGREMTAEDVAYTFRSILDPASKSPKRQSFIQIESIETPDPSTVVFKTSEPFAPMLVNLTVGVVPAKEAAEAGLDFADRPIGTGPYQFVSRKSEQQIELSAFEQHFKGAPKIPMMIYRIIADDTTRYLELIKGNLDFVQNGITPDMVPVVENKKEFKVITTPGTNYEYLAFNLQDPLLGRREVRAAIAHALNISDMIGALLKGQGIPATGLLSPVNWAYEGDVTRYSYDPEKARQLLEEAGFPLQSDGYRFTLTYKTRLSDLAKLKAEIIQQQLQEVGIKLDIRGYDWGTLFADIKSGNFQLYSLQWVGVSEPDIYYYVFDSKSVPPHGANRGRYINPELDALIEDGRRTMDPARRAAIYSKIQKIVARDLPYVSLWFPSNVVIMKKNLEGFDPYPDGDLSDLWKISWK